MARRQVRSSTSPMSATAPVPESAETMASRDPEMGEGSPLIGDDVPPLLNDIKDHYAKETIVAGVAGVSFVSSLLSLLLQASIHPSVFISGILGVLLSPYAAIQQRKITEVQALDETNTRLESEVTKLNAENERLSTQVKEVESSVKKLQDMEETLTTIETMQGSNLKELDNQLQDSKEILSDMHLNAKSELLQNLITVMMAADANGDMLLSDTEIDQLIQHLESIGGVQLKEERIKEIIVREGRCLAGIMELARFVLMDENIPPEKNIFSLIEERE